MSPTACWQRWAALKEGVKMVDLVVGYAADECSRMTVLAGVSRRKISSWLVVLTCGMLRAA